MNTFSYTAQSIALTIDSAVETTLLIADKLKPYAVKAVAIVKSAYANVTSPEAIEAYKYFLLRVYQGVVILAVIASVLLKEVVRRVKSLHGQSNPVPMGVQRSAEAVQEMRATLQKIRDRNIHEGQ